MSDPDSTEVKSLRGHEDELIHLPARHGASEGSGHENAASRWDVEWREENV